MLQLLVTAFLVQTGNTRAVCSFELLPKSRVVVVDWDGTCHRSDDAGKTWGDPSATWIRQTVRVSELEIWGITAIDLNERIACTVDGGKSWTAVVLASNSFRPMALLGVRDGCPLLVDQIGQVRQWKRSDKPKSDGSDWLPLGAPIPQLDDYVSSGCCVDETLYVGSPGRIWRSTDMGKTWKAFDCRVKSPVVEFATSTSSCWAATREGTIFQVARGRDAWTKVASIPNAWFVFGLAATDEGVFVAGRKDPPGAILAFVGADGTVSDCGAPPESQVAGPIRIDDRKDAWVATDRGLFIRRENCWTRVWPAK